MGSADAEIPPRGKPTGPIEARAALDHNLARQREIALGKRAVNTQGPEAIALADEKYRSGDDGNWMA